MKIVNIKIFYTIDTIKLRTHLEPSREISFVDFGLCFDLYFVIYFWGVFLNAYYFFCLDFRRRSLDFARDGKLFAFFDY